MVRTVRGLNDSRGFESLGRFERFEAFESEIDVDALKIEIHVPVRRRHESFVDFRDFQ